MRSSSSPTCSRGSASTAVAVKDDAFGIAEGEILVQNPINVRTALPRGCGWETRRRAGVVLTNLDSQQHA